MKLDSIESALEDLKQGRMIVLVDDKERENEGDLLVAAEKVNAEIISFMQNEGKGLICISLPEERLKKLEIPFQVKENTSLFGTNFAVSFDHHSVFTSGITAASRAKTILEAVAEDSCPEDFVKPGFVFPVCAVAGGVLKRRGQTEGSVDLAKLAGLKPAGVICEIMAEDGKMLRGKSLESFCIQHALKLISVEQIVQYRLHKEVSIRRVEELSLARDFLGFRSEKILALLQAKPELAIEVVVYVDDVDGQEHFAILIGKPQDNCLVRVHSECLTGDVFGSRRCDCGDQLDLGLEAIINQGQGVLIYLQQEGRGIGLGNKLKAYSLQDEGLDTVDANLHLGLAVDARSYRVAAQILQELGVRKIKLLTNNPAKIESLESFGIEILDRVALSTDIDQYNRDYLLTKKQRLGHFLDL